MNKKLWTKQIKRILGSFWLTIWKDTWLIDLLCDFFSFFVGTNLHRQLLSIQKQTLCTSVQLPDTTRYVKILVDSLHAAGKNVISIEELSWGASISPQTNSKVAYKAFTRLDIPEKILLNIYLELPVLLYGTNFKYNLVTESLLFSNSLPSYGFKQELALVLEKSDSELWIKLKVKPCYVLWALYNLNKSLRDTFTGILLLPVLWLYKYPGAVLKAWRIKQFGANKEDVISFLTTIGGQSAAVGSSFAYPQVLTYKDNFPTGFSGIHVLTLVGVLFAQATGTLSQNNDTLPLKDLKTGQTSTEYRDLCSQRSQQSLIPYAALSTGLSPALFIFKKVWGPTACLIIVSSDNRLDILKALQFIAANTILGTIMLAYTSKGLLLYPDIKKQNLVMTYYNKSVNNGTTYKERNKDLAG